MTRLQSVLINTQWHDLAKFIDGICLIQVFSNFFHIPPYKPKNFQFLPNKSHQKDNCKNFTLSTEKKQ